MACFVPLSGLQTPSDTELLLHNDTDYKTDRVRLNGAVDFLCAANKLLTPAQLESCIWFCSSEDLGGSDALQGGLRADGNLLLSVNYPLQSLLSAEQPAHHTVMLIFEMLLNPP